MTDNKGLLFQRVQRQDVKKLHKSYFEGLEEPLEVQTQVVQEFFYDVYQNYNVQFWGMLGNGSDDILVDSIENATRKLALDIVHRYVIMFRDHKLCAKATLTYFNS